MKFEGLKIGIPREIMPREARVSALPETVRAMSNDGARVLVESGAGAGCDVEDKDYEAVGANMVADPATLFAEADVVLKVKEPRFNEALHRHEIDMMHAGQFLITFLHPAAPDNHEMIRLLADKGVTALTLDGVPRISRAQNMDALTSMSTVAGYKAVLMAADELKSFMPMMGTAVGVIPPANVLVIGAGVAGLQALATAKRLGAATQAADIRPQALEQAASIGVRTLNPGVPPDKATGDGGYARELSEELLSAERETLRPAVTSADILILSALVSGREAPILVEEDAVTAMKPGSVIVDISVDQGGNCACTENGETVVKHGVTIIGIKNIPGRMPKSATWMFARNILNFLNHVAKNGIADLDEHDEIVSATLTTRDGKILHAGALAAMSARRRCSS